MSDGLYPALLAAQSEAPGLQKTGINPHFRTKYVSLESLMDQILPILNAHGLVLMQSPTTLDGAPALRTAIVHAKSGELVEDTMLLHATKPDPQAQGSAITYARRYSLMALLGLVADVDDDGAAASRPRQQQRQAPARRAGVSGGEPSADAAPVGAPVATPAGGAAQVSSPPETPAFVQPPGVPPLEASPAQKRKLNVLVGTLRDGGHITTEQIWRAVRQTCPADPHWSALRDTLSKQEASALIERLERFEKNAKAAA